MRKEVGMYSAWIQEFYRKEGTDDAIEVLLRIDKLLKLAMYSIDNEILYDEIREEIINVE